MKRRKMRWERRRRGKRHERGQVRHEREGEMRRGREGWKGENRKWNKMMNRGTILRRVEIKQKKNSRTSWELKSRFRKGERSIQANKKGKK